MLNKIRIVIAASFSAVATAHKEEVLNGALFHRIDNNGSVIKYCLATKTRCNRSSAVYTFKGCILRVTAELNGLLIFIGLLGGVAVFGLLGLVLGPIILATVATLFEAYTRERRAVSREPGAAGSDG